MAICLYGFLSPLFEDRVNLLNHLITEVPIPEENTQIKFFILLFSTPIIINHKMNLYKIMAINDKEKQISFLNNYYLLTEETNFKTLFCSISLEHIIFLFNMLLLEQKILLLYKDYETLSNIIFILISLLFPFSWKNNIFPIISLDMINSLENQNQFIAGMDESMFSYINKHNISIGKDIIIYNISLNNFISCKTMKKTSRKDILHEYKLPSLPDKINNFLLKELKIILKEIKSNLGLYNLVNNDEASYIKLRNFKQHIEYETKLCFIKSIIMLVGDFSDYTFFTEEKPLFNQESFIDSHKEKDFKNYLHMFVNTSIFNDFLEEQENLYFYKAKVLNEVSKENNIYMKDNEFPEIYYYNKISIKFSDLINNHLLMNSTFNWNNTLKGEIQIKADKICNNLNLINSTISEYSNIGNIHQTNSKNETQIESSQNQINKKKTSILFSGKKYLEDKNENKPISKRFNSKEKNKNLDLYYSHTHKKSKLSTEASTLNTYYNNKNSNKPDITEDISINNNNLLYIDINKQKKSKNKKNKNESMIKIYLLYPYFLSMKFDDDFYIKEHKDEQIILKEINSFKIKKDIKNTIPPCTNMLYRNQNSLENNNYIFQRNKVYIIHSNNMNSIRNNNSSRYKFKNELILFKNTYYKKKPSEKEILNLKEIIKSEDEIVIINKLFRSCFEHKIDLKEEHLILLRKLFSNVENIEYFSNLIVPEILLISKAYHKQLTILSFKSLEKIIKLSFENMNLSDKNVSRLLTLSCFIYYKLEKDKIIYLYTEFLFNKLDKFKQPYQLWSNESFWIEFFNLEFEFNNKYLELEKDNISDYEFIKKEDSNNKKEIDINKKKKLCLIKTILTLSNIMIKLNLEKNFVINIIEKMILPVFVDDFYFINEIMNLALLSCTTN